MMEIGIMKSKKNATYVKKSFVIIKNEKRNLNYTKKLQVCHTHKSFKTSTKILDKNLKRCPE